MFHEPTTLASAAQIFAVALREGYGLDPAPIFASAGVPLEVPVSPKQRYPLASMSRLWRAAREATGDECVGLKVGWFVLPQHLYALGHSWLASSTLRDALERFVRYHQLLTTASVEYGLRDDGRHYVLSRAFPEKDRAPVDEAIDCGNTALLSLLDSIAGTEIRPRRLDLTFGNERHPDAYREHVCADIRFSAPLDCFYFDKTQFDERLAGASPDIARATDHIAEKYIESLNPAKTASKVRRLLIDLLPSGKADQELIAERLHRSPSTLQRQLQAEGLSYRAVLQSTRQSLAQQYLLDGRHTHAQIAYLLGFSDQSNFSRAFKRWTSVSPREFQKRGADS
ncbi:MAG: AraC family transcriptional regulator [Pseudomonadota bacterium]